MYITIQSMRSGRVYHAITYTQHLFCLVCMEYLSICTYTSLSNMAEGMESESIFYAHCYKGLYKCVLYDAPPRTEHFGSIEGRRKNSVFSSVLVTVVERYDTHPFSLRW